MRPTVRLQLGMVKSKFVSQPSNKPTAVGAVSSAVAVHVVSRRWLSFFR